VDPGCHREERGRRALPCGPDAPERDKERGGVRSLGFCPAVWAGVGYWAARGGGKQARGRLGSSAGMFSYFFFSFFTFPKPFSK